MNRCVIIGGGPYTDSNKLACMIEPEDTIVAADAGWRLAMAMGVHPALVVADFDSMSVPSFSDDVRVITLPVKKDDTDTAIAMREGYQTGHRSFLLLGCTGGRLDHFQAALTTAAQYVVKDCDVTIADEYNVIHVLKPGRYAFPVVPGSYVSMFAFGEQVDALSAEGLEYEINQFSLSPMNPLCVSNSAKGDSFTVQFESGILLLYLSQD